jgi:hypothetical protein
MNIGPLEQNTYNQAGGYMPIKLMPSDDLPGVVIGIPFDITNYTFDGQVFDEFGNILFDFAIAITQTTLTGIISASLTAAQIASPPALTSYRMRWTNGGILRTFIYGPIEVVEIWSM